jgi:hypothetical protein
LVFSEVVEAMGEPDTTMEARLGAITASLNNSRALLASCARQLGVKEQKWQEVTEASVATMTGSLFAPDPVRVQPETKPSSPSFVSTHQAVAAGALNADTLVTPTMPTRYSILGSADNIGNNLAVLAFPTTPTMHLPAPTLTGNGDGSVLCCRSRSCNWQQEIGILVIGIHCNFFGRELQYLLGLWELLCRHGNKHERNEKRNLGGTILYEWHELIQSPHMQRENAN